MTVFVCLTGVTSCENEAEKSDSNEVALTGITVTPSSLSVPVHGKLQFTATPVPADATGVWFEWSSADPSVATVYNDGTVYMKKYTETPTTITVKSGSISATVEVSSLKVPMTEISMDDSVRLSVIGDAQQIVAKPVPTNTTDVITSWVSEDPSVATVDENGKITAVSYGTTNVTVYGGEVEATIVVSIGLADILLDPSTLVIDLGFTQQIKATAVPKASIEISFDWASEDPNVATVDETGKVTAISEGTTNIIVSYGTLERVVPVEVIFRTSNESTFKGPHIFSAAEPYILYARDFDFGGEGVAFHDATPSTDEANGSYRQNNGDPDGAFADVQDAGNVGWTAGGEWLKYTVGVLDAGLYAIDVQLSTSSESTYSVSIDDVRSASTTVPGIGSWDSWFWVLESYPNLASTQPQFRLSRGLHKFVFNIESTNFNLMAYKITRIGD
jgi:uncharacterized protein YjdB